MYFTNLQYTDCCMDLHRLCVKLFYLNALVSDIHDSLKRQLYAVTDSSSQMSSSQLSSDSEARKLSMTGRRKRRPTRSPKNREFEIGKQKGLKLIEDEGAEIGSVRTTLIN